MQLKPFSRDISVILVLVVIFFGGCLGGVHPPVFTL